MTNQAPEVHVSERQRELLEWYRDWGKTPQRLGERVRIVLMSADGLDNGEQARKLDVDRQRVRRWRTRWAEAWDSLMKAERQDVSEEDLEQAVLEVLSDAYRSGAGLKFSEEQVAQLIALACESPEELGLPVSHWTPRELAKEACRRGIVEEISARHVGRFLKGGRSAASQDPVLAQSEGGRSGIGRKIAGDLRALQASARAARARGPLD